MTEFQLTLLVVLLSTIILLQILLYTQRARAAHREQRRDASPSKPGALKRPETTPQSADPRGEPPQHENGRRRKAGEAFRAVATGIGTAIGKKKAGLPDVEEPPVELSLPNNAGRSDQVHLIKARHSSGFYAARRLVEQALSRHSTMMTLDCRKNGTTVRYLVDDVWHSADPPEPESIVQALESLKTLCGLDASNGDSRSRGEFSATYASVRYDATMASQATGTGRRVVIQFAGPEQPLASFADIGVPPDIEAELRSVLDHGRGILLLSATPSSGLRTTTRVLLTGMDRLQRDAISVEEENARYPAIEAVDLRTYRSAEGECPADLLPIVFHRDPHVIVIRDLVNGRTVTELCEGLEGTRRLAITTVRAGGCVEALMRMLLLRGDRTRLAGQLTAVLNQRLVRKLCDACKRPYRPRPQVLHELGIAAGDRTLFRPPPQGGEPCPACGGIGYRGRHGLFEFLLVGNRMREQLVVAPQPERIAAAAVEDGMRSLREEGGQLVADGVTSVAELVRVLRLFPVHEAMAGTPA